MSDPMNAAAEHQGTVGNERDEARRAAAIVAYWARHGRTVTAHAVLREDHDGHGYTDRPIRAWGVASNLGMHLPPAVADGHARDRPA